MTSTQAWALGVALLFTAAVLASVAIIAAPIWFLVSGGAVLAAVIGAALIQDIRDDAI